MFVILAVLMVLSSLATVLTKSIVRAATYLFFVLLGTAGMYFLMGYTFLGAAQVIVYAGGIIVLYVFSILLTEGAKDQEIFKRKIKDASWGFVLSFVGFLAFVGVVLTHNFKAAVLAAPSETANAEQSALGQQTGTSRKHWNTGGSSGRLPLIQNLRKKGWMCVSTTVPMCGRGLT